MADRPSYFTDPSWRPDLWPESVTPVGTRWPINVPAICRKCGWGVQHCTCGTALPPIALDACNCAECVRGRATWHLSAPAAPPLTSTVTAPAPQPSQHERLLAFARDVLSRSSEIEGVQEIGVAHGLLIETVYDPSIHGDDNDAESGDPWFTYADWLKAPVTIMPDAEETRRGLTAEQTNRLGAVMGELAQWLRRRA